MKINSIKSDTQINAVNDVTVNLENTLESSFLDYAAFIAQRRAIPDARDSMKYTARQILHAQFREKLDAKHPFKKSQKSVAAATSFSYVHGPSSCYEQIIRMGRNLVQRYYFEEIQGNGGTPCHSNDYSAERYTEARLSSLGLKLFEYIDRDGILSKDWAPTYDEEGEFPLVLPSVGFYNICNGSFGSIGVGMISSIPQFNVRDINDAIQKLIEDPNYIPDILPDFASGGILMNPKTVKHSLLKGEGKSCLLRSTVEKNKKEGWLEVTSLPYGVFTETLCKQLGEAYEKGTKIFTDFKDLSKQSVKVRIFGPDLDTLEAWLYKNTVCQSHFTIKIIMLDKGKTPKVFNLKEALLAHIEHAKDVYRRQFEYELKKLEDRQEILEGLIKAYSILDDIIACIKGSRDRADAIANLVNQFGFSARVSEAIVELKLHRLTNMDIQKLHDELKENLVGQDRIREILSNEDLFNSYLSEEYTKVAEKWGDDRRTEIYNGDEFETDSDGVAPTKRFWIVGTETEYWASTQEDNEIFDNLDISNPVVETSFYPEEELILFTNKGRAFLRKGEEIKMGNLRWDTIITLRDKDKDEKVIHIWRKDNMPEYVLIDGNKYHNSFIISAATKRGKKFKAGNWNIKRIEEE